MPQIKDEKTMLELVNELIERCEKSRHHTVGEVYAGMADKALAEISSGAVQLSGINFDKGKIDALVDLLAIKMKDELAGIIAKEANWTDDHNNAAEILEALGTVQLSGIHGFEKLAPIEQALKDLKGLLEKDVKIIEATNKVSETIAKIEEAIKKI